MVPFPDEFQRKKSNQHDDDSKAYLYIARILFANYPITDQSTMRINRVPPSDAIFFRKNFRNGQWAILIFNRSIHMHLIDDHD